MLAVWEQALFSGGSFLLTVALVRLVPSVGEYGLFAVGLSAVQFTSVVYSTAVVEPMLISSSRKTPAEEQSYLWTLSLDTVVVGALLALLLILASVPLDSLDATEGFAVAICATATWLAMLYRRRCYPLGFNSVATFGGAIFFFGVALFLLVLLSSSITASWSTALMGLACAWLGSAVYLAWRTGLPGRSPRASEWREHWRYSRWALPAVVLAFIPGGMHPILVASLGSIEDAGRFKALWNLMVPAFQVAGATAVLLLSDVGEAAASSEREGVKGRGVHRTVILVGVVLGIQLVVASVSPALVDLAYGPSFPALSGLELAAIVVVPAAYAAVPLLSSILKGIGRPDALLVPSFMAAVVSLAAAVGWIGPFGVEGALGSVAVGYLALAVGAAIALTTISRPKIRT